MRWARVADNCLLTGTSFSSLALQRITGKNEPRQLSCPRCNGAAGMESAQIVRGVVKETKPDLVLVVDALAARSTKAVKQDVPDQ